MKLGIIGMSEGNGHPYSWAAIFNGYDSVAMGDCPFAGIPAYLEAEDFPAAQIRDAEVTHIWTQDSKVSEGIAKASKIPNICESIEDMIGAVDGVLLARDDSENHYKHAKAIIEAGLPIYIDKPLATSISGARRLLDLETYPGQIFSCSALYYAEEFFHLLSDIEDEVGSLRMITARTPKYWRTYGVHIVEPVVRALGNISDFKVVNRKSGEQTVLTLENKAGLLVQFMATGATNCPITIEYLGEKSLKTCTFADSFSAFKSSLQAFVKQAKTRELQLSREHTYEVVKVLELGSV